MAVSGLDGRGRWAILFEPGLRAFSDWGRRSQAALKAPTIAVIHEFCLGGGLEKALACKWRIAIDGAKFGFPEVMLGRHQGLGGTARSTHLIDPLPAVGDSSTVEQRTLTPSILVRIQR
jgi:enoyl-CoA hydratase/carnithine racemase